MKSSDKLYYIGNDKIEGPLSIISLEAEYNSSYTRLKIITAAAKNGIEYRAESYFFKRAEELINTPIWVDGKIATNIVKVEDKEVTALFGRYGCNIIDLNRVSLKPEKNFSLTKQCEESKVPEMENSFTKPVNLVFEISKSTGRSIAVLCNTISSLIASKYKPMKYTGFLSEWSSKLEEDFSVASPSKLDFSSKLIRVIRELANSFDNPQKMAEAVKDIFENKDVDPVKNAENFARIIKEGQKKTETLSTEEEIKNGIDDLIRNVKSWYQEAHLPLFAARQNQKILVLDSRRSVLKQAFEIGAGTQIDIMRDDDPRIGQKNYDLIIS